MPTERIDVLLCCAAAVLCSWLIARGLAAIGYHIAHAVASGYAGSELIPRSVRQPRTKEGFGTDARPANVLQGVECDYLEPAEQDEMLWVDEVLCEPQEYTEIERSEALRLRDQYDRTSKTRSGRLPVE